MTRSLLALSDLHVTFSTRRGLVEAVRGVALSLGEGEMLGLVGESGSGKSVTGFAITRLLDAAGRITAGNIQFRGQDITRISGGDFRNLHGAAMAMIFQNPRAALNPIRAVGDQIADAITAHKRMPRMRRARRRWNCCAPCKFAIPKSAWPLIRMNSPAACASA